MNAESVCIKMLKLQLSLEVLSIFYNKREFDMIVKELLFLRVDTFAFIFSCYLPKAEKSNDKSVNFPFVSSYHRYLGSVIFCILEHLEHYHLS